MTIYAVSRRLIAGTALTITLIGCGDAPEEPLPPQQQEQAGQQTPAPNTPQEPNNDPVDPTPTETGSDSVSDTVIPQENTPSEKAATTPQQPAAPLEEDFVFKPLPLEAPATSMAMAEDGHYLVTTHQADGLVSIYNIRDSSVEKVIEAEAPRCVLCRGDHVFVSCFGEGTVNVYSREEDWKLIRELRVQKPNVVHLSAAGGKYFDGTLLVTCHGDGSQASYKDSHIFSLDTNNNRCVPLGRMSLASVSYDGKTVMAQGSFNMSPSGGLSVYRFSDFVDSPSDRQPISRGGVQQTPYVYQVYRGGTWLGNDIVFGGTPMTTLKEKLGRILVPDYSQKVVYAVSEDVVRAYKLDATMTEIGWQRAEYPEEFKDFSRVYHHLYRMRDYYLDHPVAVTQGERLSVFLLAAKGGLILRADARAMHKSLISLGITRRAGSF